MRVSLCVCVSLSISLSIHLSPSLSLHLSLRVYVFNCTTNCTTHKHTVTSLPKLRTCQVVQRRPRLVVKHAVVSNGVIGVVRPFVIPIKPSILSARQYLKRDLRPPLWSGPRGATPYGAARVEEPPMERHWPIALETETISLNAVMQYGSVRCSVVQHGGM